jgi:hypothetical protein
MHTVRFLILTEGQSEWTVEQFSGRFRALTRSALKRVAELAGFARITWHSAEEVPFHQPVMTGLKEAVQS